MIFSYLLVLYISKTILLVLLVNRTHLHVLAYTNSTANQDVHQDISYLNFVKNDLEKSTAESFYSIDSHKTIVKRQQPLVSSDSFEILDELELNSNSNDITRETSSFFLNIIMRF